MSKENVKEYIAFLWDTNKPMYRHEMKEVNERFLELEKKITPKEMADIHFLCDVDLCERYNLEPRELNPKYVEYVTDEKDKVVEERVGNIIVVTNNKVMKSDMKTGFLQMRSNLIRQIRESEYERHI